MLSKTSLSKSAEPQKLFFRRDLFVSKDPVKNVNLFNGVANTGSLSNKQQLVINVNVSLLKSARGNSQLCSVSFVLMVEVINK